MQQQITTGKGFPSTGIPDMGEEKTNHIAAEFSKSRSYDEKYWPRSYQGSTEFD